ncbi:MAG TPA: SRPBCC family protein [Burkholderiales bacterium]|jgi:uncharacterized protein YndB with AHSA1/START domain
MSEPSSHHATFTIERRYPAGIERVFRAWSDPARKARWFSCHDEWQASGYTLDFRVGGREHLTTTPPGGQPHRYDAIYQDIVPQARIIYAYDMHLGDKRISVSLATVEFKPEGKHTVLVFTEQAVFLDGYDDEGARERRAGTEIGLQNLDESLKQGD